MRCHSQALTIKLTRDVPLDEIDDVLGGANEWVRVVAERQGVDARRPDARRGVRHAERPDRPPAQDAAWAPTYLSAFTVGDQLLWGAAEPLRRMLRILAD